MGLQIVFISPFTFSSFSTMTYFNHKKIWLLKDQLTPRSRPWPRGPGLCHEFSVVLSLTLSHFRSLEHPTPHFSHPHLLCISTQERPRDSGWRVASGRVELEELLFDLPTTSPAMKTQHTAQAAHSCLCACSLSGVRPGCGRGSLWQWWKGISTGLGSSGTGSEGSVKRLRQATWFMWPGLWANLFLTPRSWVPQTMAQLAPSQGLVKSGTLWTKGHMRGGI